MTGDWIGLALIVLALVGALLGLSRLGRPPERLSAEEFERRVQEARGTTRASALAGMHALQKLLNPRAAEAVEAQRDLRAGYYDEKEQGGEGDGRGAVKGDEKSEGESR
jgi:hypothetical protein